MHFVTGGSFHGKKNWVLNFYQKEKEAQQMKIISSLDSYPFLSKENESMIMINGLEKMIKTRLKKEEPEYTIAFFKKLFSECIGWEKEDETRKVVFIGSDITKGIVPIEKEDREWRDITGLLFQEVARLASRVDIIWYGLNERIK